MEENEGSGGGAADTCYSDDTQLGGTLLSSTPDEEEDESSALKNADKPVSPTSKRTFIPSVRLSRSSSLRLTHKQAAVYLSRLEYVLSQSETTLEDSVVASTVTGSEEGIGHHGSVDASDKKTNGTKRDVDSWLGVVRSDIDCLSSDMWADSEKKSLPLRPLSCANLHDLWGDDDDDTEGQEKATSPESSSPLEGAASKPGRKDLGVWMKELVEKLNQLQQKVKLLRRSGSVSQEEVTRTESDEQGATSEDDKKEDDNDLFSASLSESLHSKYRRLVSLLKKEAEVLHSRLPDYGARGSAYLPELMEMTITEEDDDDHIGEGTETIDMNTLQLMGRRRASEGSGSPREMSSSGEGKQLSIPIDGRNFPFGSPLRGVLKGGKKGPGTTKRGRSRTLRNSKALESAPAEFDPLLNPMQVEAEEETQQSPDLSVEYDEDSIDEAEGEYEDLENNGFFMAFREQSDLFKLAAKFKWVICMPQRPSILEGIITRDVLQAHILKPTQVAGEYTTGSGGAVYVKNRYIHTAQGYAEPRVARILFEELHYLEQTGKGFGMIFIEIPLVGPYKEPGERDSICHLFRNRKSLKECQGFLWSFPEHDKELRKLNLNIRDFNHTHFRPKYFIEEASRRLFQICNSALKNIVLANEDYFGTCRTDERHLEELSKIVATYVLGGAHEKVFSNLAAVLKYEDDEMNKILERVKDVRPADLGIRADVEFPLPKAIAQLQKINDFTTPLEKLACIKNATDYVLEEIEAAQAVRLADTGGEMIVLTVDDLLPLLIFVVVNARPARLITNLRYILEFQIADIANSTSQLGFVLANFQAAVEYIQMDRLMKSELEKETSAPAPHKPNFRGRSRSGTAP